MRIPLCWGASGTSEKRNKNMHSRGGTFAWIPAGSRCQQCAGCAPRGERISGYAPVGWDVGRGARLVENAREQKIIVRMRRLRAEGLSCRGIAVRPDGEGIRPKRGKRWIHTTVKTILARNAA